MVKNPFERKQKGAVLALFFMLILLACFSCKKNDIPKYDIPNIPIDLTGEPDMILEDATSCYISYDVHFKMWSVVYSPPGTIDYGEYYMIAEMPYKFPFEERKEVTVSGFCYEIPEQIRAGIMKNKKGMSFMIVGRKYYYIKVTNIN